MFRKCVHEWEKTEKTLPSIAEEITRLSGGIMPPGLSPCDFRIRYILILSCRKCGMIEKQDYWNDAYV